MQWAVDGMPPLNNGSLVAQANVPAAAVSSENSSVSVGSSRSKTVQSVDSGASARPRTLVRGGRPLILTALFILSLAQAPAQNPCAAAEHHQFDFWIGDWDVTAPNGTIAGHSHVERIANGCGIEEQWTGSRGGTGRSLNTFAEGRWHQYWVGAGGSVLNLAGSLRGNMMTLSDSTNRLMFTNNNDGTIRQQWQTTND